MATAALTGTPTQIDMAEAVTNWVGDTFSLEPDIKVQGSNSIACTITPNANNSQEIHVSGSWDFSGGGSGDQHLRLWANISFAGNLQTEANNGWQIYMSDGTNASYWTVGGSDSYAGGWKQFTVYTGNTPSETSGTLNKASITQIGFRFKALTKPRNVPANAWFDAWYYGDGYTVTGGTNGDPIDWSHIASVDSTNAYGIVNEQDGVYFLKGAVQIGDGTSTTYFEPANQICQFTDEQVSASLYEISFVDTVSALTNVNIAGGAWSAAGTQRYLIDATDTDINSFAIDGVQISRAADLTGFLSTASITNCAFNDCLQIDPSTSTFENNTISNSTATDGALLWPGGTTVTSCAFIGNNRAIEITQTTNQTFDALAFTSNTNDVHLNNGGTSIDVAKNNGSDPTSYVATGGGVVTYTGAAVGIAAFSVDSTGSVINDTVFYLAASGTTGTPFPVDDTVTIVNSGTTATVTHTGHGMASSDRVRISGASHGANNGVFTIAVTGANTYTYTMGSTPGSSPTGTIKSTFVFLYGTATSTNTLSMNRVMPSNQAVTGWVRKSSGAPYYKQGVLAGTVSSVSGGSFTGVMVSDD